MLNENRIKEAESNIKSFLHDNMITRCKFDQIVYDVLYQNAKESLDLASDLAKNSKSELWTIVISYYSMFYIANATLYKLGYKIGERTPHKVTSDALIVYVRKKLKHALLEDFEEAQKNALAGMKTDSLIESFDNERKKRSFFQYTTTYTDKKAKANTLCRGQKNFILKLKNC